MIVAYVTRLGHLYCKGCHEPTESDVPVYAGSYPHAFEACDWCSLVVDSEASAREARPSGRGLLADCVEALRPFRNGPLDRLNRDRIRAKVAEVVGAYQRSDLDFPRGGLVWVEFHGTIVSLETTADVLRWMAEKKDQGPGRFSFDNRNGAR